MFSLHSRMFNNFDTACGKSASLYEWRSASYGKVFANAVRGGVDPDGTPLYVGRTTYRGDRIPGKITKECCWVAHGGSEHKDTSYEVLCSDATAIWQPASNGAVPAGAIQGGYTDTHDALYVGRAKVKGYLTPGKVQPSHGVCYAGYYDKEYSSKEYEVLILRR